MAGEVPATAVESGQGGAAGRALVLEIREMIAEAIDARLWAVSGVRLVLERDLSTIVDGERPHGVRASADRAIMHWNAMTLVMIYGGIEDFVESMGSGLHPIVRDTNPMKRKKIFEHNRTRNRQLKASGELTAQGAHTLTQFTKVLSEALLPKPLRAANHDLPTADRWEDLLSRVYMRPIRGRPLPEDLRLTLNELGAVRNVILHRMSRMDERALAQVTEGPWRSVNERVVIDDGLYQRYIAALVAYQRELEDRMRSQMKVDPESDINTWRTMVPAGG